MRRAVVTGAGGFIGRALVTRLCDRGLHVTAVTRAGGDDLPCAVEQIDAGVVDGLTHLLDDQTTLFHFAGHTSVSGSVRDPRTDFNANVIGFLNALESARQTGARVVFPSSAAVFRPGQDLPLSEDDAKGPVSPYGAAKLACEQYARTWSQCYDLDVRVARLFNVYGVGMTRFAIYDFYKKLCEDATRLEMLGDGNQLRDYLYIDDTLDGLLLIAEAGQPGEDYNLGSGVPTCIDELAHAVAAAMGLDTIELSCLGHSFPGDISRWLANTDKLSALGFRPRVDLATGLERTIAWFRQRSQTEPEKEVSC